MQFSGQPVFQSSTSRFHCGFHTPAGMESSDSDNMLVSVTGGTPHHTPMSSPCTEYACDVTGQILMVWVRILQPLRSTVCCFADDWKLYGTNHDWCPNREKITHRDCWNVQRRKCFMESACTLQLAHSAQGLDVNISFDGTTLPTAVLGTVLTLVTFSNVMSTTSTPDKTLLFETCLFTF